MVCRKMDGQRIEMGPEEVSFKGDQNTKEDREGRKGHRSGTVGDKPVKMMIVQLKGEKWMGKKPGYFEQKKRHLSSKKRQPFLL